jgi:hypothetical protein
MGAGTLVKVTQERDGGGGARGGGGVVNGGRPAGAGAAPGGAPSGLARLRVTGLHSGIEAVRTHIAHTHLES